MTELTAPITLKDKMKRIVYGPVLIPGEADSDGDVVSKEKIEEVAHTFVEEYGNMDVHHSLNNVGKLVESYVLPHDMPVDQGDVLPAGTWMLGTRVTNDAAWKDVVEGKLAGFSIMAVQGAITANKTASTKRTTLADLGDDWVVNAVSLVDEPAVPRAKFLAIKSAQQPQQGAAVSLARLENMMGSTKEDDMDEEKFATLVGEVVAQHLEPLYERVNQVIGQVESEKESTDDGDAEKQTASKQAADDTASAEGTEPAADDQNAPQATTATENAETENQADEETEEQDAQGESPAFSPEQLEQLKELLGQTQQPEPAGKSAPFSHRLPGQDGTGTQQATKSALDNDRDAFGRKIRK